MCFLPDVLFWKTGLLGDECPRAGNHWFKELQLKGNLFDYPKICRDDSYISHQHNRVGEFANSQNVYVDGHSRVFTLGFFVSIYKTLHNFSLESNIKKPDTVF